DVSFYVGHYILLATIKEGTCRTCLYTLSLHDALPICARRPVKDQGTELVRLHRPVQQLSGTDDMLLSHHLLQGFRAHPGSQRRRSEEHTSELQSRFDLVCRLLLEKINSIK